MTIITTDTPYYNYYALDGKTYSTKLHAVLASSYIFDDCPIKWVLPSFEKEILKVNLFEEPTESLDYLYKQRAEQLRNNYDYLILHYSGGHDSHNILETFLLNNIFLDEILILDQFDKSFRKKLEDSNFEFLHLNAYEPELSAIPLAKHFVETYSPNTKITIVENVFGIHTRYWVDLKEKEIIDNLNSPGTLGMIGKTPVRLKDLNLYNADYKKIKQTKKVAHIWGRDKASVKYDNYGYYFNFDDGSLVDFINSTDFLTKDQLPQNVELFYTHPDSIKMILKQCYLIMQNLPFYKLNYRIATRKHEDLVAKIIYNRKVKTNYQSLKTGDYALNGSMIKHLNKKRDVNRDMNFFQISELSLVKQLGSDLLRNFNLQTEIISKFLKCYPVQVESKLSQSYATDKFYFKHFND